MKTFTRILCLLLCLVLTAGLVPAAAEEPAEEPAAEEVPAAEEIPAGENGNGETGEKPAADDKDEDFRNILSKRAEGKNDEVE